MTHEIIDFDKTLKRIHDLITAYSANKYLKGGQIDTLKQIEYVGLNIAQEAYEEANKDTAKEIIDIIRDFNSLIYGQGDPVEQYDKFIKKYPDFEKHPELSDYLKYLYKIKDK